MSTPNLFLHLKSDHIPACLFKLTLKYPSVKNRPRYRFSLHIFLCGRVFCLKIVVYKPDMFDKGAVKPLIDFSDPENPYQLSFLLFLT